MKSRFGRRTGNGETEEEPGWDEAKLLEGPYGVFLQKTAKVYRSISRRRCLEIFGRGI